MGRKGHKEATSKSTAQVIIADSGREEWACELALMGQKQNSKHRREGSGLVQS